MSLLPNYWNEHALTALYSDYSTPGHDKVFKNLPGYADSRLFVLIFGLLFSFLAVVWFFFGGQCAKSCFRRMDIWRLNPYGSQEKTYSETNGLCMYCFI